MNLLNSSFWTSLSVILFGFFYQATPLLLIGMFMLYLWVLFAGVAVEHIKEEDI